MVKDQLCKQICKGSDLFVPVAAEHTAAAFFKTQEFQLPQHRENPYILKLSIHSTEPPVFFLLKPSFKLQFEVEFIWLHNKNKILMLVTKDLHKMFF